jgi:hypothetical protein
MQGEPLTVPSLLHAPRVGAGVGAAVGGGTHTHLSKLVHGPVFEPLLNFSDPSSK